MSVAVPLWFWKFREKNQFFLQILKIMEKVTNYNFQSRRQILTLGGVYKSIRGSATGCSRDVSAPTRLGQVKNCNRSPLSCAQHADALFLLFPYFFFFLSNFCKHPRKLADICVGVRLFVYLEFFNSHQQRPTGALHHAVKVMELF